MVADSRAVPKSQRTGAGTLNALTQIGRAAPGRTARAEARMSLSLSIGPVVALVAGILILVIPRLLNYIIALYLIIIGIVGLLGPGPGARADANDIPPAAVHGVAPEPAGHTIGI